MALACQRAMRRIKVSVGITDTRQRHLSLIHRPQTTGSVNNMVQMAASPRWEPYLVVSLASMYVMMTSGLDSTTNRRLLRSVETTNIYWMWVRTVSPRVNHSPNKGTPLSSPQNA